MAVITSVNPRTSVKIGGIPVDIEGSNFLKTDRSQGFDEPAFYTLLQTAGGSVSAPSANGVTLSIDGTLGSKAGVLLDNIFDLAFETAVTFERTLTTLVAVDGAKIFALRAYDDTNSQTNFYLGVEYSDALGYYIKTEARVLNNLVYSDTRAIGPYDIAGLKIQRSEGRMTGYVQVGTNWIEVSDYLGFSHSTSRIEAFIENSTTPVTGGFDVVVKEYQEFLTASASNAPMDIVSVSDTLIEAVTKENIVGTGNLYIGFQDGSIAQSPIDFIYTEDETVKQISNNFDMALAVYNFYVNPTKSELFTDAGGFKWDEDEFIAETKKNDNLYVPTLWDPTLANIPSGYFQSGYGFDDDTELIDIIRLRRESEENWHARLNHGTYFIKNVPYYLYSEQSSSLQLGDDKTEDGRSKQNLYFLPKYGVPVSASTLQFDVRTGNIIRKNRFIKVASFTGKAVNGVELDTANPVNIDTSLLEFKVNYNSNNMVNNFRIPVDSASAGIYSFQLPKVPLFEYPVIFNRPDIFQNRKFTARKYNDADAIYNQFPYGTGPEGPGDYTVNYVTGEVQVWLDQDYVDLGYVTFTFDYPAVVEFNNDYVVDMGSSITDPEPSDLSELDELGISDLSANQEFIVDEFPIFDLTDNVFLDRTNFRLFVYDPSSLVFDLEWTRVRDFSGYGPNDKVYILNSDRGSISFGDGINGAIPPKYHRILAGYKISARIEYEPMTSVDYWTGKSVDLNLSRNNLSSGFLYLSRKDLVPDSIVLDFKETEITALEFTALTARVFDIDGEPIPNINIDFTVLEGAGSTEDVTLTSDSNGSATTTFLPSGNIEDIGMFINPFEPGSVDTKGSYIPDTYSDNNGVPNSKIIADVEIEDDPDDVYLFKIYDRETEAFTPYDNLARSGGLYQVYYKYNSGSGQNELIRPTSITGRVLVFEESLPQSHDPLGPNYEPDLRGFVVIGRKTIRAQARVRFKNLIIDSEIASLKVTYSPIQKGEWTLPILPTTFTSSEIDRATYITINP
jgi:hypothetical protein